MFNSLVVVFSVFLVSVSQLCHAQTMSPVRLRCEGVENAFIDNPEPLLSWGLEATSRNKSQSAFELIVSSNPVDVRAGRGAEWNSGKIQSSENIHVAYRGAPLKSFTRYWWAVKVYDEKGEASGWSAPAWFETAFLPDEKWSGKWISDGSKNPANDADAFKPDRMPLLRKAFDSKAVVSARLYISGLGYYEAYINGSKVGDQVLDPGWTSYKETVLYAVHDVTKQVKTGTNTISVMLGNGWWNPLPIKFFGRWDLRQYQQTGRPCLIAELHLVYADGTKNIIATDESWSSAPGPVYRNSVYLGEHYDARLEQPGWPAGRVRASEWKPASITEAPRGTLRCQMQPPIRITKIIRPKRILNPAVDTLIYDLGENFAGVARIRVKGKAGTRITLRYGEDVFPDNRLNYETSVMTQIRKGGIKGGPGAPETAWQEDSYTLKGNGVEVWSPRFTFHGFRYVEVTGWPGKPTLNDLEGLRMNSDVDNAGSFQCSNEMLNDIQEVTLRTFLSNIFSVQSDCPAREKMGYGADLVVSANAFIYNFDMHQFYAKTVQDFADEQLEDGGITEIAPFTGIADRGYGGNSGPLGWQLAFPFLQKQLYDFYGDRRIIEQNYDRVRKQMDFLKSHAYEGLYHWDIGDHEALDPRAEAFSASCFYYHHLLLASEFAGILGRQDDSIRYASSASDVKRRIVRKYHVPGTGRFDNATQAAQIFALWYDLSPDDSATHAVLLSEFERHDWHVSSGIFGIKMMFDELRERDENALAYRLATQKDFPGWGHMLARGATTLWESWEFPEKYASRNHPMFGSISEWYYRSILGINPDQPGFKTFIVKPQPAGDLQWAKGTYKSVRGEIVSDWKISSNRFELGVTIPANTQAEIWIPATTGADVMEGGNRIEQPDFSRMRQEGNYRVVTVGSGTYRFISSAFR